MLLDSSDKNKQILNKAKIPHQHPIVMSKSNTATTSPQAWYKDMWNLFPALHCSTYTNTLINYSMAKSLYNLQVKTHRIKVVKNKNHSNSRNISGRFKGWNNIWKCRISKDRRSWSLRSGRLRSNRLKVQKIHKDKILKRQNPTKKSRNLNEIILTCSRTIRYCRRRMKCSSWKLPS